MRGCIHLTIISGGQTGVDRAALDAAIELGMPHGGWCPKDRLAEDGKIPQRYALKETPLRSYRQRTEFNVRDSDATLIITWGGPLGGTGYTLKKVLEMSKPHLIVDMTSPIDAGPIITWIRESEIMVLNIAGPRESFMPGIVYLQARDVMEKVFSALKQ